MTDIGWLFCDRPYEKGRIWSQQASYDMCRKGRLEPVMESFTEELVQHHNSESLCTLRFLSKTCQDIRQGGGARCPPSKA